MSRVRVSLFALCGLLVTCGAVADDGLLARAHAFVRPPITVAAGQDRMDALWRLGRNLFADPRLSASGRMSCATCHVAARGLSGTTPRAIGDAGRPLAARTPSLIDTGHLDRMGWTGRFPDLAAVSLFAATTPGNMNKPLDQIVVLLRADDGYVAAFHDAFGPDAGADKATLGAAFARYVGSITTAPSSFDRWAAGDAGAMNEAAVRGFATFTGKAGCATCHAGPDFTDGSFHDIGLPDDGLGRGGLFKTSVKLQHAFKTPGLRNVSERALFMHDGSIGTLDAVIAHYDRGGIDRPSRADGVAPLHLTAQERADLLAFLRSLESPVVYTSAATPGNAL